jgi:short-subunit dehydrogenase
MKRSSFFLLGGLGLAFAISRGFHRSFSFTGKTVVITGGSRGLGLTIARQLAAEGARLALIARDENELARACAELRKAGAETFAAPCDLLDREQSLGAIEKIFQHYGAIDVLINNAGMIEVGPLANMQREDFEKSMRLHFWAPFNLIEQVVPHMRRAGGGRIVNIASIGGKMAVPHLAPYCASKFALVGLSDAFRAELARDRICLTTVTPGLMRTGSQVNAKFKGDHGAEYTWFALSAALPIAAVSAERAAAKIIGACRRGQSALTIGWSARTAIISQALFPCLTSEAMKLANRFLPGPVPGSGDELRSGWEAREEQRAPAWLATFADDAIARHNED